MTKKAGPIRCRDVHLLTFPVPIGSLLSPLLDAPNRLAFHDELKKLGERHTAPTHRGFVAAIS